MLNSNRINAINVLTVEARRQPLRRTLRVAGVIDDNDARHRILSAYVDGRIDRLFVNFTGAEVTEGQPLATIYSPMLLAAEREYVALASRKPDGVPPAMLEEHARLIDGARQRLRRLGLADQQIAALPEKPADAMGTGILAPLGGTVVSRMAYEGQYVKEGDKLFELADFSTMWFRFDAYERDLVWLKPGQSVEVTTPSAPGKTYVAPIAFIDPNVNDPTRSAKVRVEIPNPLIVTNDPPRRELLHRLFAEGFVNMEAPDVLAIPRSAVLAPGRPYVFVDKGGGVYEPRKLKLGRAGDELWEVLEGLQQGERVVTTGNLLIDAQAQLDGGGPSVHNHGGQTSFSPSGAPGNLPHLDDAQQKAAAEFLSAVDALTSALAADDVPAFNRQLAAIPPALARLAALTNDVGWAALIQGLQSGGHLSPAADLKGARRMFHPFSMAVVEFAKAARRHGAAVHIFQCPMVNQAVPGAPKTGYWIQSQAQIRNPFFGAEMIDCGAEVK
jgi:Cu(I)/Ag(I) efflux system membrane fusion protein